MSSKQKKNFDFDKKIPKPKKTEGNPNDHKAIMKMEKNPKFYRKRDN